MLDHATDRLWEVSVDGLRAEEVVKLAGKSIRDLAVDEAAAIPWSNDAGKTLYVRTHDAATKQDGIYAINTAAHSGRRVLEGDFVLSMSEMGTLTGVGGGRNGTLLYSMQSASRADDIWKLDLRSEKSARLTTLNPQYDPVQFGSIRIIDWRSLRGESLQGTLLLPAGYTPGKKLSSSSTTTRAMRCNSPRTSRISGSAGSTGCSDSWWRSGDDLVPNPAEDPRVVGSVSSPLDGRADRPGPSDECTHSFTPTHPTFRHASPKKTPPLTPLSRYTTVPTNMTPILLTPQVTMSS